MQKDTSIIILNYNNYQNTITCVNSILNNEKKIFRLIIIDNGSTNNSFKEIELFFINLNIKYKTTDNLDGVDTDDMFILFKFTQNIGYAKGNNIGLRLGIKLGTKYLVIMNNDIIITEPFLTDIKQILDSNKKMGLITPLLKKQDETIDRNVARKNPSTLQIVINNSFLRNVKLFSKLLDRMYLIKDTKEIEGKELLYADLISGSCMMMKSETFLKINGFDENTFLYFEENILYEKLKQIKLTSCVYLKKNILHIGAESTKKINSQKLLEFQKESLIYYLRNYRKSLLGILIYIVLHKIRRILLKVKLN